jgi:broad specificity phosphatase PhoE
MTLRRTTLTLAAAFWALAHAASAQTVVLARHAEKADGSRDPELSQAGTSRAEALAAAFGPEGPDVVIVSPLRRTGLTAAPTVGVFRSPVRAIPLEEGVDAHVAAVVAELRARPADSLILVVGHSNTIPLIARALGVEAADMADCEYDRLIRIDLNATQPVASVTRYGAASRC